MSAGKLTALAPCPFCGGEAELRQNIDFNTGKKRPDYWFVICGPCDLIRDQAYGVPRAKAIAAWNTRTPSGEQSQ